MNEKLKNAFDHIHAEEALKKNTKEYIFRKMETVNRRNQKQHRRMTAAAACLTFLVFGLGGWFAYFVPVSAISVDVNPSMELEINRFDKVVSSVGYNEDGRELLSELDIRFQDYRAALEQVMESEAMEQYLEQDHKVSITVSGKNEQKNEELMSAVSECMREKKNVSCDSCSREEADAAREAGVSFGKYKAFIELQSLDPDVTIEEIKELTMRQIKNRIAELSGNSAEADISSKAEGTCTGHGNGKEHLNGYGQGGKQKGRNSQNKKYNQNWK